MGTDHHRVFDPWWEHATANYVTWQDGRPVAMDLYYDPVVDEHVSSPMALLAPVWYRAPQRPVVAHSIGEMAVAFAGLDKLVQQGIIKSDETVVVNCSGHTFPVEKHIMDEEMC